MSKKGTQQIKKYDSLDWELLRLGQEQHGFIAGRTGSGKSSIAEFLVNDRFKSYSVVYDPKHSRTLGEWANQTRIYSEEKDQRDTEFNLPMQLVNCEDDRIMYRPCLEEAESKDDQLSFFKWIYVRERTRIYVDECSSLLGESHVNRYLKGCLQRGREKGISVLNCTQRPVSIPLAMISEASKVYLFALNLPEDRQRMAKVTGVSEEEQEKLLDYEFYFYDATERKASEKMTLDLSSVYEYYEPDDDIEGSY